MYLTGDTFLDCPQGAFWCDAEVLEKNILSKKDSFAFSDKVGFPVKDLNLRIV